MDARATGPAVDDQREQVLPDGHDGRRHGDVAAPRADGDRPVGVDHQRGGPAHQRLDHPAFGVVAAVGVCHLEAAVERRDQGAGRRPARPARCTCTGRRPVTSTPSTAARTAGWCPSRRSRRAWCRRAGRAASRKRPASRSRAARPAAMLPRRRRPAFRGRVQRSRFRKPGRRADAAGGRSPADDDGARRAHRRAVRSRLPRRGGRTAAGQRDDAKQQNDERAAKGAGYRSRHTYPLCRLWAFTVACLPGGREGIVTASKGMAEAGPNGDFRRACPEKVRKFSGILYQWPRMLRGVTEKPGVSRNRTYVHAAPPGRPEGTTLNARDTPPGTPRPSGDERRLPGPRHRLPAQAQRRHLGGAGSGRSGGAEGNERLTALTGAVLLLLLAAEGVTILRLGRLLTAHFFIGMLLLGPVRSSRADHLPVHPLLRRQRRVSAQGAARAAAAPSRPRHHRLDGRRVRYRDRARRRRPGRAANVAVPAQRVVHRLGLRDDRSRAGVPAPPRKAAGGGGPGEPAGRRRVSFTARTAAVVGGRGIRLSLLAASLLGGLVVAMLTVHLAGPVPPPLALTAGPRLPPRGHRGRVPAIWFQVCAVPGPPSVSEREEP